MIGALFLAAALALPPNGEAWKDTNGRRINAHGGGMLRHGDKWWWYGEDRGGDRTQGSGVHVYSSADLTTWKDEGLAFRKHDNAGSLVGIGCVIERPKVVHCAKTGKFVMYFHLELADYGYTAAMTGICTADRPEGPFRFQRALRPNPCQWPQNAPGKDFSQAEIDRLCDNDVFRNDGGDWRDIRDKSPYPYVWHYASGQMSRDMTLYQDTDGKVYHFYASEYNSTMHIAELTDDCLGYTGRWWRMGEKDWTEAPAVFRHGGKYWLVGSGCTGWNPNPAHLYVADRVTGPWRRLENPCRGVSPVTGLGPEKTFGLQSTYAIQLSDDEVVLMFDEWRKSDLQDSRYHWIPVRFTSDGQPVICPSPCGDEASEKIWRAVSPDGLNEIRLFEKPLACQVLRRGVPVTGRMPIDLTVDGASLAQGAKPVGSEVRRLSGREASPVYKKDAIDLGGEERIVDFGDWAVRLAARNDGVAYRFETKKPGRIRVNGESAPLVMPEGYVRCWANRTGAFGQEESVPETFAAEALTTIPGGQESWTGKSLVYLPFVYAAGGACVAVTESDVRDYPIWNFERTEEMRRAQDGGSVSFASRFASWPLKTARWASWHGREGAVKEGGRKVVVTDYADYLTDTEGTRTFPWRTFVLADSFAGFCEADIVRALAAPAAAGADFSWVRPGKVAWDWWNAFDNQGEGGCNTKTYERFIDFAAANGIEYVILDEGWSEFLNIWKFHPNVDVPRIIAYGRQKGVGIILWMAWAQVLGDEERVARHFAKLGAKGFKVDFMDRGDAQVARFLEKFADVCAKERMLVDYHGVYRPVGLSRRFPNIVNYEGIHGLEQMKWFERTEKEMMENDVRAFYLRLTAGPMDYTPGAMINHPLDGSYKGDEKFPGSVGTRCRQLAMMVLYEAPLQMLCDSPTNYEKNRECLAFMAKVPTVWRETRGLAGTPDTCAACARRAPDGAWYAACITTLEPRDYALDTAFLGAGEWTAEIFRDAPDADRNPERYVRETRRVRGGDVLNVRLVSGGGFAIRFSPR